MNIKHVLYHFNSENGSKKKDSTFFAQIPLIVPVTLICFVIYLFNTFLILLSQYISEAYIRGKLTNIMSNKGMNYIFSTV